MLLLSSEPAVSDRTYDTFVTVMGSAAMKPEDEALQILREAVAKLAQSNDMIANASDIFEHSDMAQSEQGRIFRDLLRTISGELSDTIHQLSDHTDQMVRHSAVARLRPRSDT